MVRILICDPICEEALSLLKSKGYELIFAHSPPPEELKKMISDVDVIIVRSATKVTKEVIDRAKRLKIIARAGAGLDNIDVKYAISKGIKILRSPGALSIAVAELTIGLMIALLRKFHIADARLKEGKWLKHEFLGSELYGKTLGIIGLGNIGSEVALRAKAFGMRVIGYKRHNVEQVAKKLGIEPAFSLEDILKESDIITLHVPLTSETYHMISEREFNLMKDGVYVVNTSRGAVIDGRALLKALENGKVAGAALDVHEHEPPREEWEWRLIKHPRVIATPHIGSMTKEAQKRVGIMIAKKIIKTLENE